jgi:hypothetical protein
VVHFTPPKLTKPLAPKSMPSDLIVCALISCERTNAILGLAVGLLTSTASAMTSNPAGIALPA